MKRLVTVLAFALVCALYFGPSVSAIVTNGDFEAGSFSGWTKSRFINNGLSVVPGVGGADLTTIVGGPGVTPLSLMDARTSNNVRYPAYGNYSAKVNSENSYSGGGNSRNGNRIQQTLPAYVDPADGLAHVKFTYAAVMVNPTSSPHTNEQKPYFRVRVVNQSNGNDVLHDFQSFVGEAGKNWQNGASFGGGEFWQYLNWTLIDLKSSPAHPVNTNDLISIEVTAAGCEPSGHPGYVYIDEITDNEIKGPVVQATGPTTAGSGGAISYTYNYRNGATTTVNPTITTSQPVGVVFGSVSDTTNCALSAGTVTCNYSNLAPGGAGTFTVNGSVTASNGATIAHGAYEIAATGFPTLGGQTVFTTVATSPTSTAITSSANPSVSGQNATLTATVTPAGGGTPTGNVQFTVGGVNYGAPVALSGGTAQLSTSGFPVGANNVQAIYNGFTGFAPSTSPVFTQTVNPANSVVTVTTSPNPAVTGQGFTITANVGAAAPGSGTPTGTVTFYVDGVPVCTGVVLASGQATCNAPGLPAGNHVVTATYSGNTNFNGNTGTQSGGTTVNPANTTLGLAASPNPSQSGQAVTVTATVAPVSPGAGTPTGTVTFSVNGSAVCTNVPMTGAQATCSLPTQNAGNHPVTATYNGDANFNTSNGSLVGGLTVNPANTTLGLSASPNPSVSGQAVTVTATVAPVAPGTGTPTGTVTFSVNGSAVCTNAPMTGAQATCVLPTQNAGNHPVTATYNGDANFNTSNGSLTGGLTVNPANTTLGLSASPNPSVTGQGVTVTATVAPVAPGTGSPTGTVTFSVNGSIVCLNVPVVLGQATCNLPPQFVGNHPVTATYSGSSNHNTSNGTLTGGLNVNPANTTTSVASSANPSVSGQAVTFTATVSPVAPGTGAPTGTVTFSINGSAVCTNAPMTGNQATCPSSLNAGNHTVSATYNGDANYNGSNGSLAGGQGVGAATTSTSVASSANPSVTGQSVTFTATVSTVAPGSGTPTGTATFSINGSAVCTNVALTAGVATCSSSNFTPGTYPVSVTYNGSANSNSSTGTLTGGQVVNAAATSTAVASSVNPSVTGQSVTFTASVSAVAPGAGTPTGTVTFSVDGSAVCTNSPMTAGVATCSAAIFTTGNHPVSATYNADANFNGSTGSLTGGQNVNAASTSTSVASSVNPSVTGQSVTFTATVSSNAPGSGTPTGTVTFSIDGSAVCTNVALTAGVATCSSSALNAGTHPVAVTYNGDANYNTSSGSLSGGQVVNKADTTTAVSASPNPAAFGETVTFTANVTANAPGAGTPTGNVTFVVDGSTLCASAVLAGGSATCSTSSLSVGSHTVSATYNSDANFNGSNGSLAGGQSVGKSNTTTAVAGSQNPSVYGQPVTFTATVAPVAPGSGTPTGTVSFNFDGLLLCNNVAMTAAQATCTVSNLTGGTHVVTAAYNGDDSFNTSAGSLAGGPQVVNKADSVMAITNQAQLDTPTHVGESYPVNWTVTLVAPGAGTPTGSVIVSDGSASCTAAAAAQTCNLTSTTPGTKTITATYAGDGNVNGSSAAPATHVVNVMITGRVQQFVSGGSNTDMSGVSVSLSGSSTATATTDSNGRFTFTQLAGGGSFTVAATASGFTFDPLSRSYSNVNTNVTNANFVGYDAASGVRDLRVISQYLVPGEDVIIPLNLTARGNESTMEFSLGYSSNPIKVAEVMCGADAPGCSISSDASTYERLGISVTFATPPTAGDREVVKVRFRSHGNISVGNTLITFEDEPIVKASADGDGNPLATTYTDGAVIYARGIESDVSGRYSGDGGLLTNDIVLLRRFVVGADHAHPMYNEFQRADSAPAITKGDGQLDATDIVQARRFITGLDPSVAPGGPYRQAVLPPAPERSILNDRKMTIGRAASHGGGEVLVPVTMSGNGDEVATSFTLEFDPSKLTDPRVELASGVEASLTADVSKAGRITVLIDATSPLTFAKSERQLLNVRFNVAGKFRGGAAAISFVSDPTPSVVSDQNGRKLDAGFFDGQVTLPSGVSSDTEISGSVQTPDGSGLRNAQVVLTDAKGNTRTVTTGSAGNFTFDKLPAGGQFTLSVVSRRYTFESRSVTAGGDRANVDLVATK